jgi:hypothetical protein
MVGFYGLDNRPRPTGRLILQALSTTSASSPPTTSNHPKSPTPDGYKPNSSRTKAALRAVANGARQLLEQSALRSLVAALRGRRGRRLTGNRNQCCRMQ